jgi:hypothetical protein
MATTTASALALSVALLAGCGEKVDVHVECASAAGPTVQCEIVQQKGTTEVEVCWDFKVVCKNGTTIAPPRSCTKVKDGGTVHYTIPPDKLVGTDQCDAEPKATLSNITVNGEADK